MVDREREKGEKKDAEAEGPSTWGKGRVKPEGVRSMLWNKFPARREP